MPKVIIYSNLNFNVNFKVNAVIILVIWKDSTFINKS